MVIVKVMAGLGNQMFEYALYRALLEKGRDAKIDLSFFDTFSAHYGYELKKVFNIKEIVASKEEAAKLAGIRHDFLSRAFRKFVYRKKTHYIQNMEEGFGFLPEVFEMDNVYLQGYWQSEKYFKDIEDIIRKEFTFKNEMRAENVDFLNKVQNLNTVSIHVRRGDYVQSPNLGGICTLEYYENAVDYIKKRIENPYFCVFSDDIPWCKNNMKLENCVYIDWNRGFDSYQDMQLMSLCKHNIIANSSFSWWGAWLNNHASKIVIAPEQWFQNKRMNIKDLIPETWIRVPITKDGLAGQSK